MIHSRIILTNAQRLRFDSIQGIGNLHEMSVLVKDVPASTIKAQSQLTTKKGVSLCLIFPKDSQPKAYMVISLLQGKVFAMDDTTKGGLTQF